MLGAGLLHAVWNALIKSGGGEPLLDTALVALPAALLALPLPFVVRLPDRRRLAASRRRW